MKVFILITLFVISGLNALAHEDTPIVMEDDGTLVGLPSKFGKAHFDTASFTLAIGNKKIEIPDCIKEHFKHYQNYTITFAASWYHDDIVWLPNYIYLNIKTDEEPEGYNIFFNLETLEIFDLWKPTLEKVAPNTLKHSSNEIQLSDKCRRKISESILTTHE